MVAIFPMTLFLYEFLVYLRIRVNHFVVMNNNQFFAIYKSKHLSTSFIAKIWFTTISKNSPYNQGLNGYCEFLVYCISSCFHIQPIFRNRRLFASASNKCITILSIELRLFGSLKFLRKPFFRNIKSKNPLFTGFRHYIRFSITTFWFPLKS